MSDGHQCLSLSHNNKINISVTIGTSAAARFITSHAAATTESSSPSPVLATADSGLFMYRSSEQEVLVGGALTDAGSLVAWFKDLVGKEHLAELMIDLHRQYRAGDITELLAAPRVLPFWSGERSTGWRHASSGSITGLSHHTSPLQLLVSLLDGVMMRLREIILQLDEVVSQPGAGAAIGNNTASFGDNIGAIVGSGAVLEKWWVWRQMLADVTNLPVLVLKEKNGETTLNGLAIHMLSSQEEEDIQQQEDCGEGISDTLYGFEREDIEEVNFPIKEHHILYEERFQEMRELYNTIHSTNCLQI